MRKVAFAGSLVYVLLFIGLLIGHPGGPLFSRWLLATQGHLLSAAQTEQVSFWFRATLDSLQIPPPYFAALGAWFYAARGRHESPLRRWGWISIGLAAFSFGSGQAIWMVMEIMLRLPMPAYGLPDIGYLATYPFLFGGIMMLFGAMPVVGRTRLLIDCALISGSVGVLSWYFLVQGWWKSSDVSTFGKLIFISYPLSDVACLFGALVLIRAASNDLILRRSMAVLATGLVLLSFVDTTFSYYNLQGLYETGSWFDWGWPFGWGLIGWAPLFSLWHPARFEASASAVPQIDPSLVSSLPQLSRQGWKRSLAPRNLWRIVEPYAFVTAAISVITWRDHLESPSGRLSLAVFLASSFLIFLVVLRQVLTLIENQHLTGQLRAFAGNLEQMVLRRTEQLSALHQLTKAANNTLQVDGVLDAALTHTRQAMQADAVVLRLWALSDEDEPMVRHVGLEDYPRVLSAIQASPISDHPETMLWPVVLPAESSAESLRASALQEQEPAAVSIYLQAPLLHRGRIIGVIGVVRWNGQFGPAEPDMLESIGVEVGTAHENARLYGAALEAADRDPVTALFNHRAIHQRLDDAFRFARHHNTNLSIIMMDLNNFKLFNDTYGHPVGDQVLKRVADGLRADCRDHDLIGRYGGDEFIVVLPDANGPVALAVAQRLRSRMSREGFQRAGDQRTVPVTLSFGIAVFPDDADDRHELLTLADANLYNAKLTEGGIHSTSDLQRISRQLKSESSFNVLDSMVVAVDNKDRYTRRHSEDVTEYGLWIAEEIGMSQESQRLIRVGGLLHDVGKIGVPEEILRKPGRLTPEEYEVLKRHPQLGSLIVSAMPDIEPITDIVRSHHERWDGGGYPDGLRGEEIPFLGRLMAVADAFSAMTTQRPYRQGLSWEEALREIENNIGTQFDPDMARAFLRAARLRAERTCAARAADALHNSVAELATAELAASNQFEWRYGADAPFQSAWWGFRVNKPLAKVVDRRASSSLREPKRLKDLA